MSTHALIGVDNYGSNILSVRCQEKGQLSHTGAILHSYYQDPDKAMQIIQNHNLFELRKNIGYPHRELRDDIRTTLIRLETEGLSTFMIRDRRSSMTQDRSRTYHLTGRFIASRTAYSTDFVYLFLPEERFGDRWKILNLTRPSHFVSLKESLIRNQIENPVLMNLYIGTSDDPYIQNRICSQDKDIIWHMLQREFDDYNIQCGGLTEDGSMIWYNILGRTFTRLLTEYSREVIKAVREGYTPPRDTSSEFDVENGYVIYHLKTVRGEYNVSLYSSS